MRHIVTGLGYVAGVVVFLHGVAGSRLTYNWVPESVAGHRVIRPDFRGHGAAARTPGNYRISDYVEDVIEVLRAEGPAILVGHSLGGVAAWSVAQQAPELVRGAFLEDPPLYRGEPEGHATQHSDPALPRAGGARATLAGLRRQRGRCRGLAGRPSPTVKRRPTTRSRPAPTRCCISIPRCWTPSSTARCWPRPMSCRPSTCRSACWPPVPRRRSAPTARSGWARRIPRVQVVRVEGAGHSIHDERAFRDDYFAARGGLRRVSVRAGRA